MKSFRADGMVTLNSKTSSMKIELYFKCHIKIKRSNSYKITIVEYTPKSINTYQAISESIQTMFNMPEAQINYFFICLFSQC